MKYFMMSKQQFVVQLLAIVPTVLLLACLIKVFYLLIGASDVWGVSLLWGSILALVFYRRTYQGYIKDYIRGYEPSCSSGEIDLSDLSERGKRKVAFCQSEFQRITELLDVDDCVLSIRDCDCDSTALHFSETNTLVFNPEMLSHPDQSIAFILGHEVGHAKKQHFHRGLSEALINHFALSVAMFLALPARFYGKLQHSYVTSLLVKPLLETVYLSARRYWAKQARAEEFSADAFGAQCTSIDDAIAALREIEPGEDPMPGGIGAFLQSTLGGAVVVGPRRQPQRQLDKDELLLQTHPTVQERIEALENLRTQAEI